MRATRPRQGLLPTDCQSLVMQPEHSHEGLHAVEYEHAHTKAQDVHHFPSLSKELTEQPPGHASHRERTTAR